MDGDEWRWIRSAADPQGCHQPCHPVLPCKKEQGPAPSHTHGAFPVLFHGWEGLRAQPARTGFRAGSRARREVPQQWHQWDAPAAAFPSIHLIAQFVPCAGGVLCQTLHPEHVSLCPDGQA